MPRLQHWPSHSFTIFSSESTQTKREGLKNCEKITKRGSISTPSSGKKPLVPLQVHLRDMLQQERGASVFKGCLNDVLICPWNDRFRSFAACLVACYKVYPEPSKDGCWWRSLQPIKKHQKPSFVRGWIFVITRLGWLLLMSTSLSSPTWGGMAPKGLIQLAAILSQGWCVSNDFKLVSKYTHTVLLMVFRESSKGTWPGHFVGVEYVEHIRLLFFIFFLSFGILVLPFRVADRTAFIQQELAGSLESPLHIQKINVKQIFWTIHWQAENTLSVQTILSQQGCPPNPHFWGRKPQAIQKR